MKHHLTERDLIEYRFRLASDKQVSRTVRHLSGCAECRQRLQQLNGKFAALDLLQEDIEVSDELISRVVEQAKRPAKPVMAPFSRYHWIGAAAAMLVVGLTLLVGSLAEKRPAPAEPARGAVAAARAPHTKLALPPKSEEQSQVLMVAKDLDKAPAAPGLPTRPSVTDSLRAGKDLYSSAGDRLSDEAMPGTLSLARKRDEAIGRGDVTAAMKPAEEPTSDQRLPRSGIRLSEVWEYGGQLAERAVDTRVGRVTEEKISEQAPFAPASAIELVVLPRRDTVQLTIYNSADLTLVRERRNLTLKRGWNWLQFMWANTLIDPTSLSLEPLEQADKIDIQQLVFPARLRELGRWLIRSEVSGRVPFEITYFTSGLSWRAFYMGTLSQDEKTMRLDGYVRVGNNSGEDYEDAQTRLIVGKVHLLDQIAELAKRRYPYGMPMPLGRLGGYGGFGGARGAVPVDNFAWANGRAFVADGDLLRRKEIRKEGLSEYFLYTIEGTETIADKWGKRLLSFEAENIPVKSLYKYDEERWSGQTIRFVSFANDEEHKLGDTPIPNGTVRIYGQADEQGYLSYVGGTNIKYIPVNEEVELNLGPARLVEVEPMPMDFKTDNYVFDKKKNVAGWDEVRTWRMEITNTRTLPIEIEITRGFGTAYWGLQAETPYEKYDATHARFKLTLEPRTKRAFEYTVTTHHGTRQEVMAKR